MTIRYAVKHYPSAYTVAHDSLRCDCPGGDGAPKLVAYDDKGESPIGSYVIRNRYGYVEQHGQVTPITRKDAERRFSRRAVIEARHEVVCSGDLDSRGECWKCGMRVRRDG